MKALGTELSDDDIDELKGLLSLSKATKGIEVNLDQFRKIVEQTPAASAGGTETGAWITQLNLYESFIPLIDEFEYLREADDDMSAQDKLAHVRGLQDEDVRKIVQDASELLVGKLLEGIKALKDLFDQRLASRRDVQAGNSKFSGDGGGGQVSYYRMYRMCSRLRACVFSFLAVTPNAPATQAAGRSLMIECVLV